jgi:hypothetical protein
MKRAAGALAVSVLMLGAVELRAQDYRVRIDARAQSVWFRGLDLDSALASTLVQSPNGGFETPDGRAARCTGGTYCFFFRPGPELQGIPVSTSASLVMWGLGVEGLSLHASGRLVGDLGDDDAWPGREPSAQLLEGLLEYRRSALLARAGRQLVASRLEAVGFDGALLRYRLDRASLEITGYGGWGLGQAAAVSPTSPALNPLDEWRPRDRQIVAGAEAAWLYKDIDLRAEYRREIDPEDDYFVSERTALSLGARTGSLRIHGGMDYNIAEGRLGNADVLLTLLRSRSSVSVGARRYRPYFSLWTLWGAFSPVPYNAFNVSAETRLGRILTVHARGERYSYEDAEVSTALVPQLRDRGWRARLGGVARFNDRWIADANYEIERGPGASVRSADAAIGFTPGRRLSLDLYAGALARPLELRYYDAESRWIGGRAQLQLGDQRRIWADAAAVSDERNRPDPGESSLDQLRLRAGMTIAFGSGADRTPLPPARPTSR